MKPPIQPVGHWQPGEFFAAISFGIVEHNYGWLWGGVAIQKLWNGSPKGRRPPAWSLIHTGSGHRICVIEAPESDAFQIADQVVGIGDWSFEGIDGWRNTDHELMARMGALVGRLGKVIKVYSGSQNHDAARAIAYARAG